MTKQVHTILCWILTISLVWLPLSVSADTSLSAINKDSCHEINSTMPGHDMPNYNMPNHDISDQKMNLTMSGQATAIDSSMHAMMQKACCDNCDDNCVSCMGMTSCGHSSNHVSAFILFNQYASHSLPIVQFSIEQFIQYHNQIITPDFRPPIV